MPELDGATKLHLGCGSNPIADWANLDLATAPGVIKWDLIDPLPVADGAVKFVFTEHFIEHVDRAQGRAIINECHRVLEPGGILRVSTPDLKKLVEEYSTGRLDEWLDVGFAPSSPCRLLNEGLRSWGHQFVYDEEELGHLLTDAGFESFARVPWHSSTYEDLRDLECRPYHGDLIFEAVKAGI